MTYLKNIPHETVLSLPAQLDVQPGQVISKTLAQNEAVSITLFSFSKGEAIGTHDSTGDAMVTVLEGLGQTLVLPAKKPHAVFAEEDFKMLLTVVFPED